MNKSDNSLRMNREISIEKFNRYLIVISFFVFFVIRPMDKFLMIHYKIVPNINFTLLIILMLGLYFAVNFIVKWDKFISTKIKPEIIIGSLVVGVLALFTLFSAPNVLKYATLGQYINTIADVTIQGIFFYIIGINYKYLVEPSEKVRKLFYIGYIMFVATVLWGIAIQPESGAFYVYMAGEKSYFTLSDSMAIYSFLILVLCKNKFSKFVVTGLSTLCLYATLSRTSLYLFVGIAVLYWLTKLKNLKQFIALACVGMFFATGGVLYLMSQGGDKLANNRMMRLIVDKEEDQSYRSRQEILSKGKKDIKENFLTGKLLVEVERGEPGKYIHNILSYLQQYGVVVFILFILLFAYCGLKSVGIVLKDFKDEKNLFLASMVLYTFVAVLFSRAYNYVYIWMAIGMCLEMNLLKTNKESSEECDDISISTNI